VCVFLLFVVVAEVAVSGYSVLPHVCTARFSQVIMALAFGALMFSQTPALNEIGFMLSFSVLWDTFVVRYVLLRAPSQLLALPPFRRACLASRPLHAHCAAPLRGLSNSELGLSFTVPPPPLFDWRRSLVVPSIMGLLGKAAWWPRKFAAPTHTKVLGIPERDVLPGPCQGARRRRDGGPGVSGELSPSIALEPLG
jgi:hypothetical protein